MEVPSHVDEWVKSLMKHFVDHGVLLVLAAAILRLAM
jgi:hypothetical protein